MMKLRYMIIIITVLAFGSALAIPELNSVINPDKKFLRYGIEPDKSLRSGIIDCIVKEDESRVAFLDDCYYVHFPELVAQNVGKKCPGVHQTDSKDLIWIPKECVYGFSDP
ncbi:MAG: hypothetical protein KGZ34_06030 [Nitrosarchaeum sp.]|nr:hypothetical protein [Nitrosarchaeum sp.]